MPENYNSLLDIIQRCYNGAALNPGIPSRHTLKGGLRISILMIRKVGHSDQFKLQLDRVGDSPPSMTEWQTVLKHWPWHVNENHMPNRICMIGDIPPKILTGET